uniref:SHC adaptor protein 4 n=1 Tax=Lates calcarifer TaxID=8187 RepID=A0A4W6BW97_LATCA
MREQTLPRFKSQTGLLPGMLKRTKYSRLRNDSLTSLEDCPQRMLPLKRELGLDSDFAQLDPGTPSHHGPSTLRDFIPRVANIRLQSPISLRGLRGQMNTAGDTTIDGHTDRPLSRTEWGSGPNQRFCSQPSLNLPLSTGQNLTHSYMGSVEVTQSMRTLDFDTRMQVTREAISRLCEKTSAKTTVKTKRPAYKGLSAVLGQINLQFSGSKIILSVSTDSVTLIAASSLQKIAHHPMQAISFASGGDSEMADCIAYVAKDLTNQRACHILECPQGRACEVINSIGQAFETRFRQLLCQTPSLLSTNPRLSFCILEHCDYYNVIPGKTPPPGGMEDVRITRDENKQDADMQGVRVNCCSETQTIFNQLSFNIRRKQAESLLTCSGDFLVRESSSASGQYVLSGMEGATVRHLLLVDPHGQVRTRDQVFLSVGHLVRFHMENQMPIISGSSELRLKQPILQRH